MRAISAAFCLRKFARRDRDHALERLCYRIAKRERDANPLWCMQLWAPGGPYPTVNVDAGTRIVYPPSLPGTFAVSSTVAEPNASPSQL